MELLKLLSTNELVAELVNFLILLLLLRIFFWKPILKLLDQRKEKISSDLKTAEDIRNEASKLKKDYENSLKTIEETTRKKIQEGVEEGRKLAEGIKNKASEESQRIIESAKAEVKEQILKAREELKESIIDLTIKSTQRLLCEKTTEATDKKLIEDFLEQVEKEPKK